MLILLLHTILVRFLQKEQARSRIRTANLNRKYTRDISGHNFLLLHYILQPLCTLYNLMLSMFIYRILDVLKYY